MVGQEVLWLLNEKYNGEKSPAFFADLARLEAGEPLAYIIGHVPFLNTTISLTSRPLIPRSETEYWVAECLAVMRKQKDESQKLIRILDLCAGSGAIGVAIAAALPEVEIDFIEIAKEHLPTIAANCARNGIDQSRVRISAGNLLQDLPKDHNRPYDFILTNPPYIDASLLRTSDSVKEHEPALALYGGEAGLELIAEIISSAAPHLTANGQLWLEHEPEQSEAIAALGKQQYQVITHTDQYGVERFSQLVLQ